MFRKPAPNGESREELIALREHMLRRVLAFFLPKDWQLTADPPQVTGTNDGDGYGRVAVMFRIEQKRGVL